MGGVILVALFSEQGDTPHHNNNSTTNLSDTTTDATMIHETPLGYVVSHMNHYEYKHFESESPQFCNFFVCLL